MRNTACQCPLAHLVTLEVDWYLWWDPNSSVTDMTRSDRLKGNDDVARLQSENLVCIAPAAFLCSRCDQWQLDAISTCQCALARLVYTRSRLVSRREIPVRRSHKIGRLAHFGPPSTNGALFKCLNLPKYCCWPCPSLYDHSVHILWWLLPGG